MLSGILNEAGVFSGQMRLKLGEYTSQLMESMWIMSQRECAVVAQKFKLTKIIVFQIRAIDFTHKM